MWDFVNDAPAPVSFLKNDTLINFLERWMERDARIDFIHFSAYELEWGWIEEVKKINEKE